MADLHEFAFKTAAALYMLCLSHPAVLPSLPSCAALLEFPMRTLPLLAFCAMLPVLAARADEPRDNWPQWRGPDANGVAPKADPPLEWNDTTNIKWKAPLTGKGSATPIVWGDRVFVL